MLGWRFEKWRDGRPRYIRAAHYFSDGWPLDSLLVMRRPRVRRELKVLRGDGFNTIIIVVPWRGFQVTQNPVSYDDFYGDQLRLVLDEARSLKLAVILRVAYTHQLLPGPAANGIFQAQLLLTRAPVLNAWLDYHAKLHSIVRDYPCCIGAFVSWEELWHAFANWQTLDLDERVRLAERSGYAAYLERADVQEAGDATPCIPERDSPYYVHYHAFVNQRMVELFRAARERLPMLGVEGRVDRDPLYGGAETQWLENERFYDLEPARYSYWAPFFGAENQGEAIDVDAAVNSLTGMLRENSQQGTLPGQVVEQFNFIDDTARYAEIHARIHNDGVSEFLGKAAALLRQYSSGYGLWAYRSYRANVLYNAAFLDGGRGWTIGASSAGCFQAAGGVQLQRQQCLAQQLRPKVAGLPRANPVDALTLQVEACGSDWSLRARINGGDWSTLHCDADRGGEIRVSLDFESIFSDGLCFELEVLDGAPLLRRLFLFSHVYCGGVRDADGEAETYLGDIRRLNRKLG